MFDLSCELWFIVEKERELKIFVYYLYEIRNIIFVILMKFKKMFKSLSFQTKELTCSFRCSCTSIDTLQNPIRCFDLSLSYTVVCFVVSLNLTLIYFVLSTFITQQIYFPTTGRRKART